MNGKKSLFAVIEWILLGLIICTGIYNAFHNDNFWVFSLPQVLTLLVAIILAFGAVQYKNDERKAKEQAEKVVEKIQNIVSQKAFYTFPINGDPEELDKLTRISLKKISNCLTVLKDYSKQFGFVSEAEYIEGEYKKFNDLFSENPNDLDYLSKSERLLKNYAENIDSKCDQIIAKLYK